MKFVPFLLPRHCNGGAFHGGKIFVERTLVAPAGGMT